MKRTRSENSVRSPPPQRWGYVKGWELSGLKTRTSNSDPSSRYQRKITPAGKRAGTGRSGSDSEDKTEEMK